MSEKYEIIKTQSGKSEVVDHASDLEEAQFFATEYAKDFGPKVAVTYRLNSDYQE